MKSVLESVMEFNNAFEVGYELEPSLPDLQTCILRHRLMKEENGEYIEACGNKDLVGIADSLGDMLYILAGTMLAHGMQDKIMDVFEEIHRSNMSKLGPDNKPMYREDGKVIKGPNYSKPDLRKILDKDLLSVVEDSNDQSQ